MTKSGNEFKTADSLPLRIVSAAIMVPAGLFVVFQGGILLVLACITCGLGMWLEYWHVTTKRTMLNPAWFFGAFVLSAGCVTLEYAPDWMALFLVFAVSLSVLAILIFKSELIFWLIIGLVSINGAVLSLVLIRDVVDKGLIVALLVMVCVWATDIAAYFAGKGFGGPQLSPKGSPNKTWSGAAGAVICSALIGVLFAGMLQADVIACLVFTAVLSIISQAGDLAQSYWKRRFGVKDAGAFIPGHGGLLDRLDSFSVALLCVGIFACIQPDFPISVLGLENS